MKSIILRLVLASALAVGGLTACKKADSNPGAGVPGAPKEKLKKDGTKKKLKKDGTKKDKKDKKPKDITDPVAPATPAPPAP